MPHPELIFDLLAGPQHVHDAGHHDTEDLTKAARELERDRRALQTGAGEHGHQARIRRIGDRDEDRRCHSSRRRRAPERPGGGLCRV